MRFFLGFLLFVTALFLILIVLVQRGRGGGLTGALGGPGGQSAFGSKAGDLFTRITVCVAAFWILLCIASIKLLSVGDTSRITSGTGAKTQTEGNESGSTSTETEGGSSSSDSE